MDEVSAFVLAGGQSSRMGADKAFLQLEGQSLLIRALNLVTGITPNVRILGSKAKFGEFGKVVEDEFPNHGPLGGIHAALCTSSSELNLILAVDMPFVPEKFLRNLVGGARQHDAVVTVPKVGGQWQPLCAIYRRPFADVARDALEKGHNRIDTLFGETTLHVLEESELAREGLSGDMFRNLNTPEDLREATFRLQETLPAVKKLS
jgi:molybdopterin-guanine dinucleotide biosynthesis protein A